MKRVLAITGGSRGIGAAVARLGAERGYDLAILYRSEHSAAEALVEELVARHGIRATAIAADCAEPDQIAAAFATIDERLGRVTHLVNNAGITGLSSRLDAVDARTVATCIAINVTGAILVAREAVRRMAPRHGGTGGAIVNISSVAARLGSPGEYVWYAASKGAIDSFTIGLAREVAADGIRVNAVSPGLIHTDIHVRSTGDGARVQRLTPMIPMGRPGEPDEIAQMVMMLLSEEASYTTGAILDVSGGR